MDRTQWKQERRLWNEVRMDTLNEYVELSGQFFFQYSLQHLYRF